MNLRLNMPRFEQVQTSYAPREKQSCILVMFPGVERLVGYRFFDGQVSSDRAEEVSPCTTLKELARRLEAPVFPKLPNTPRPINFAWLAMELLRRHINGDFFETGIERRWRENPGA
jgi:hypothetical protein